MQSRYDLTKLGGKQSTPSYDLSHLGGTVAGGDAAGDALQGIQKQIMDEIQTPNAQMQEGYSNPAMQNNFGMLPKQEQMQRLSLSSFDPANRNSLGGIVPGGTYENDISRNAAATAASLMNPEMSGGNSLLMRYFAQPVANSMSRIGSGSAANMISDLPNIKNMDQAKALLKNSLSANAILEAGTSPLRIAGHAAEILNPIQHTRDKIRDIQTEYAGARQAQRAAYDPVTAAYGNTNVTNRPSEYLGFTRAQTRYFTPEIRRVYQDFIGRPTFDNLHRLQSQMYRDAASLEGNSNKINTLQTIRRTREQIQGQIQNFLARDPQALASYNRGIDLTRDLIKPYEYNEKLTKVARGQVTEMKPQQLRKEILKGVQEEYGGIPVGHPLRNHLRDLDKFADFGNAVNDIGIPAAGLIGGEIASPGLGGAITGLAAGGGARYMMPGLVKGAQNPLLERMMRAINPLYYSAGRTAINQFNR